MTGNARKPAALEVETEMANDKPPGRKPEAFDPPPLPASVAVIESLTDRRRKTLPWGRLLALSLGTLLSMMIGLWIWSFVDALFARFTWLGWIGLGLAALAAVALAAILAREIRAVARLREITAIREQVATAGAAVTLRDARNLVREIERLYAGRPDLAAPTSALAAHRGEVMDGADLLKLAERDLIGPLDDRAADVVAGAARRVSVVTAVSPRALIDVGYVLWENARLIGRIATLYGGRPGRVGFFRLARRTLTHLAVTSSVAFGDSLLQQAIGHGLTGKLSARLGEGVLNGLLTARIGLAAVDICRPMPFSARTPPTISKVMSGILPKSGDPPDPDNGRR